jgi:hypothetical protein
LAPPLGGTSGSVPVSNGVGAGDACVGEGAGVLTALDCGTATQPGLALATGARASAPPIVAAANHGARYLIVVFMVVLPIAMTPIRLSSILAPRQTCVAAADTQSAPAASCNSPFRRVSTAGSAFVRRARRDNPSANKTALRFQLSGLRCGPQVVRTACAEAAHATRCMTAMPSPSWTQRSGR